MPVYHFVEEPAESEIRKHRVARAPVINGYIHGVTDVVSTEAIKDDLGQTLAGTVHADGRLDLTEPSGRRVFWTGWVR